MMVGVDVCCDVYRETPRGLQAISEFVSQQAFRLERGVAENRDQRGEALRSGLDTRGEPYGLVRISACPQRARDPRPDGMAGVRGPQQPGAGLKIEARELVVLELRAHDQRQLVAHDFPLVLNK